MILISRPIACWFLAWGVLCTSSSIGQESPTSKPAQESRDIKSQWQPIFEQHANDYVILSNSGSAAKRLPDSLLRWSQPVRGGDDGAIYLWEQAGRPVAVIGLLTYKGSNGDRVILHERLSLASGPLTTTWRGRSLWKPSRPGLAFKPVPTAPTPAETPSVRLRQMQALLRDFSATTTDSKNSTWTMRALTKPLHRYEAPDSNLMDGALFALAQGNDAEVFISLEARGQGQQAHWEYAVARFTDLAVRVELQGREVFTKSPVGGPQGSAPYFCSSAITRRSDSPDDFR